MDANWVALTWLDSVRLALGKSITPLSHRHSSDPDPRLIVRVESRRQEYVDAGTPGRIFVGKSGTHKSWVSKQIMAVGAALDDREQGGDPVLSIDV